MMRNKQVWKTSDVSDSQACGSALQDCLEAEALPPVEANRDRLGTMGNPLSEVVSDEADAELDQAFPNCRFTHLLVVISVDQLDVTIRALSVVNRLPGSVESLRLTRIGGKLEHRFMLTGLRPAQARSMAGQLAAETGVERSHVEHHIITAAASRDRS